MEKFWIKSYPSGVPETINPDSYSSLTALLLESCHKFANKAAFENFNTRLTYREILQKSTQFAAYLQQTLQLVKGDRIGIMLPNLLQYPIVLLAALQLGLVVVNINPLYTERELILPLKDSQAKAVVVLANCMSALCKVIGDTSIKHVIVTQLGDELTPLRRFLINNYLKYIKKIVPLSCPQATHYARAFKEKLNFQPVQITSDDLAFLQYTGGTTGKFKGAMLTHRNLVANILQCVAWIDHVLQEGQEVVVAALPLYHIFSLTVCCFAFMKLGGASLLITDPRDLKTFLKTLRKRAFTVFAGVNTLYKELIQSAEFRALNFEHLKLSLAGGMSVVKSVAKTWQSITGNPIIMGYGLTEASPVVSINPLNSVVFSGSIGLPVPSTQIAILDDAGREVGINEPGELCVAGPQVMLGYWPKGKQKNEPWLHTGDIVSIDEKGYLYLIDRKKDMIIVSGFNVYPNEIEEVIGQHPGVLEVAVIGVPNDHTGETVKAFIVKKDPLLSEQEVLNFSKQRLTGYKMPKYIEFCESLPKTSIGKLCKEQLR